MTKSVLNVEVRGVYGQNLFYPKCAKAKSLSHITGTKTLTLNTLIEASREDGLDMMICIHTVHGSTLLSGQQFCERFAPTAGYAGMSDARERQWERAHGC